MSSTKNTEPDEYQKMSENERMIHDAMSKLDPLPSPPDLEPKEEGEGEFNLQEYMKTEGQRAVDNLNRNALKNG